MLKWCLCCLGQKLADWVNIGMDYYWFAFLDTASFFNEWCNYIGETLDWGCLFNVADEQFYTVHNLTGLPLTVS